VGKFQITGKLHTEKLHDLHSSRDMIKVMKSKKIKLKENVICIGEEGKCTQV
jgi:hypothetical protein